MLVALPNVTAPVICGHYTTISYMSVRHGSTVTYKSCMTAVKQPFRVMGAVWRNVALTPRVWVKLRTIALSSRMFRRAQESS